MTQAHGLINKIKTWTFCSLLAGTAMFGFSDGSDPKCVLVQPCGVAPAINGEVGEPWKSGAYIKDFLLNKAGKPTQATEVWVTYDQKYLYLAFQCMEQEMSRLSAETTGNDNDVWQNDSVEIFLNPLGEGYNFYHLILGNNGYIEDQYCVEGSADKSWDSNALFKVKKLEDRWILTVAVPFQTLGFFPQPGDVWKVNFCRSRLAGNPEYSTWSGLQGSFHQPDKFGELRFGTPADSDLAVQVRSLGQLNLNGNIRNRNKIRMALENKGDAGKKIQIVVSAVEGKTCALQTNETRNISGKEKIDLNLAYKVSGTAGEYMELKVTDLDTGKTLYKNKFPAMRDKMFQVWRPAKPWFYHELLSKIPTGIKNGWAMFWTPNLDKGNMRNVAKRYGCRYSYAEQFEEWAKHKIMPIDHWWSLDHKDYQYDELAKKYGVKVVLRATHSGKKELSQRFSSAEAVDAYLSGVKESLEKHGAIIWGVCAGDEQDRLCLKGLVSLMKETPDDPYLKQIDAEIKKDFGFGKYGLPVNPDDENPFRSLALRRWLNAKLRDRHMRLRELVKKMNPDLVLVSTDPIDRHKPYEYSLQTGIFDVFTKQMVVSGGINFPLYGAETKILSDLTRNAEVWILPHLEHFFSTYDPEEVRAIYSQIFMSGGTGFHLWPFDRAGGGDTGGLMNNKYPGFFYTQTGSPMRWRAVMEIIDRVEQGTKVQSPDDPDFAIFYSNDSYLTTPIRKAEKFSGEVEYAYALLGQRPGSWFRYIDEGMLLDPEFSLNKYKVIYLPYNKYQRSEVASKLKEYVNNGGILVSLDPEVFSYDVNGNDLSGFRKELFKVRFDKEKQNQQIEIQLGSDGLVHDIKNQILSVEDKSYQVQAMNGVEILAKYGNGDPAIVMNNYGKGKTVYFSFSPLNQATLNKASWAEFFRGFHKALGIKTDCKIWRFQFPEFEKVYLPPPKGVCVTGNYIEWVNEEAQFVNDIETGGCYWYDIAPDEVQDRGEAEEPIPFMDGKLTDRIHLPQNEQERERHRSPIEDWIVSWSDTRPVSLTVDLIKPFALERLKVYYSDQLSALNVWGSRNGDSWEKIATGAKKNPTKDVLDEVFSFEKCRPYRYLRMDFGARDIKCKLTLVEMEIWARP